MQTLPVTPSKEPTEIKLICLRVNSRESLYSLQTITSNQCGPQLESIQLQRLHTVTASQ